MTRLARHALRSLAGRVWEREASRAGRWSAREVGLMRQQGGLAGWEVEYVRSPLEYPELSWDVDNVRVVRDGNFCVGVMVNSGVNEQRRHP